LHKVFNKLLGSVVLLLTVVVLLSIGTSGSVQAYDVHSPILILDNTDLISFGFPGDGSEENPFLIQNYEIDGAGGSAIAIYDVDLHVKIRNCLLSDSSWPSAVIHLENARNVTIENNRLVDSYVGVWLVSSNGIVIRNNTFENHGTGIALEYSDLNVIINNTCVLDIESPTGRVGIQLRSSNNNSLEENNCSGNNAGIDLTSSHFNALIANICNDIEGSGIVVDSSINNTVTENICRDNYIGGITLNSAISNTTGNMIDNNICSGNGWISEWGAGIFLSSSTTYAISNNTVSNNDLSGNLYGIWALYSLNNSISYNTVHGNIDSGIFLRYSSNNTVSSNDVFGNANYGIWALSSPNNTISSNTVHGNSASGIYISLSSNSTVSSNEVFENVESGVWIALSGNCTVSSNIARNNFDGIYLEESDRNLLFSNDLPSNTYGIFLHVSSFNTISFNECNLSTGGDGIYLWQSNSNGLFNNYCDDNAGSHGIFLGASHYNVLLNNTCDRNLNSGVELRDSLECVIANNTCTGNANGIRLWLGNDGNVLNNNTCLGNSENGIYLRDSDDCTVYNNTANGNSGMGIYLYISSSNWLLNNTCNGNNNCGIKLSDSDHCTISNNTCNENTIGIWLNTGSDWNDIKNNTCLDSTGDGVRLTSSHNNDLVSNTCASPNMFYLSSWESAGIYLDWSNYNTIANNTCYNNADGLNLDSSEYNTVSGNNLSYNNNYMGTKVNIKIGSSNNNIFNNTCLGSTIGISINSGNDIRIEGNNLSYNNVGIEAYNSAHERLVIANNTCNNNGYGMYLRWLSDSLVFNNTCVDNGKAGIYFGKRAINNEISNNTIRNNGYLSVDDGYGMAFAGHGLAIDGAGEGDNCYGNIIANNTIEDNRLHGINITSATDNRIFGNVLMRNNGATSVYDPAKVQAWDSGTNFWNDTGHGNLWGDWTSPDTNGDGIVDNAYLINGGANMDHLPLAVSVAITSPANGSFTSETNVDITGIATSYFGVDHLTWHNAANDASGACSGTDIWTATIPLADGDNVITITMVDLRGFGANASIIMVLDVVPPVMEITNPADGAYVGSSVTVTWTGSDDESGIAYYLVSIEGAFSDNVTGSSCTINDLAEGTYTVLVSAYDAAGNYLDVSVTINVDITAPTVTIESPADNFLSTDNSVTVTWNGSDIGSEVDRYEVSWEGGSPVTLLPGVSSYTFTSLSDGSHVLTVVVYDKVGLSSTDTVAILIDAQPPSLTITSPAQGGYLGTADVMVTWSGSDAGTGIAYYWVSMEGLPAINTTGTSYTFNDLADGTYTVLVSAYDQLGNYQDETVTFTVDTVAPIMEITSPAEGQLFNASSVTVTWASSDANPGTAEVKVGSGAWVTAIGQQFVLTGLANGAHRVYVRAADAAGNSVEVSVNFTVDTDAPEVRFVFPAEGSLVNSTTGTVEWEAEDATTIINTTLLRVDGGAWSDMDENHSWDYSLEDGTHTIEVKVTDLVGNSASVTLNITVDATAPTAEYSPIGDDLELDQVILVEFSEVMNQTSVSITVAGVSGTVAWEGNSASFTPSQLLYNTVYEVTVSGMDLAGNLIDINWTFSTRSVGNITGVILDENGDPVANVTVTAGELTAVTDGNGRFLFVNLSVGTYLFEVDADGYEPFSFNATIEQGITVDEGTVEMVPEESEDEEDDGGSIWLYAIIVILGLAVVGAAAFFFLRKK